VDCDQLSAALFAAATHCSRSRSLPSCNWPMTSAVAGLSISCVSSPLAATSSPLMKCLTVFICCFRYLTVVLLQTSFSGRLPTRVITVGHVQGTIQNLQTLAYLVCRGYAGRGDMHTVEMHEWPQALLQTFVLERLHRLGILAFGIEGNQWCACVAVRDQLHGPEHAEAANIADAGMALGKRLQSGADHLAAQI